MSSGLSEISSPGVQPVLPDEESVDAWILQEHLFRFTGEAFHILTVFQNGQPFTVIMSNDTVQTF